MKYTKRFLLELSKYFCFPFLITCFFAVNYAIAQSEKTSRPNVILILADDMGLGDIALHNGGLNRTPHLDKLVKESVWFEQGYSASAVCAPARAGLLTGRYPHRTGVVGLDLNGFPSHTSLNVEEVTIADIFAANNYHTGVIGKWHLGNRPPYHPMKRGFKEFTGFFGVNSYYKYRLDINGKQKNYDGEYLTDVLTEYAIDFVNRNKEKPFFLHLAHYAPHRPLDAPAKLTAEYEQKGFNSSTAKTYAMVEIMDKGIGRLMDELTRLGLRENTIVIFTSDNGPDPHAGSARFNQKLRGGKYDMYEGGIHVPMLVNWKGKLSPSTIKQVVHFTDILPTIADMCQIQIEQSVKSRLDGQSFTKLFNQTDYTGKPKYWHWNRGNPYYHQNAAMREGDWKLVYPPVTSGAIHKDVETNPLLFNIKKDPMETTDVAAQHQVIYKRMWTLLDDWARKMEAERLRATSYDN